MLLNQCRSYGFQMRWKTDGRATTSCCLSEIRDFGITGANDRERKSLESEESELEEIRSDEEKMRESKVLCKYFL